MKALNGRDHWVVMQRVSFACGVAALIAVIVGAFFDPAQFLRAYLLAFLFWLGIPLGCLGLLMLYHLVGGAWGLAIRNLIESAAWTLPLFCLAVVPLLLETRFLYPWANRDLLGGGVKLSASKLLYFKTPFYLARTAFYFTVWCAIAWTMRHRRAEHPFNVEAAPSAGLRVASGWGLASYCLVTSFAAFDWVMSLEPNWYSSVYGMIFVVGEGLTALATVILLTGLFTSESQRLEPPTKPWLDLGNLLLAFLMLWAYLAYMQFLVAWSGNLKEEIPWYMRRSQGGWQALCWFLFLFHFLVPFALLLSRKSKTRIRRLAMVAGCVWLSRLVDYFWTLGPLPQSAVVPLHWAYVAAPVALGGIWFGVFLGVLKRNGPELFIPVRTELIHG